MYIDFETHEHKDWLSGLRDSKFTLRFQIQILSSITSFFRSILDFS